MMPNYIRYIWLKPAAVLIVSTIVTCAMAGEPPEARIIRTDRLPTVSADAYSIIPARDPFAWPVEQLRKFEGGDTKTLKDPFAGFTLNGIIWTENEPVAIINNRRLRKGDRMEDIKVIKIDKNSVIIANRRTSRTLRFPDPFIELGRAATEADK